MLKVLSILNGHHATAGIFEDGKCLNIFHEEKFNNIKNYSGFPEESIKLLHKLHNLKSVDYIVFGSWEQFYVGLPNEYRATGAETAGKKGSLLRNLYDDLEFLTRSKLFFLVKNFVLRNYVTPRSKAKLAEYFSRHYEITSDKLIYFDHHLNHNLAPLFFYGLADLDEDVLLISIDGAGDLAFTKAYVYHHGSKEVEKITESTWDYSLGGIYSDMTMFLGMKPNEHEYKVMGLAAYVSEEKYYKKVYEDLKSLVTFDRKSLTFKTKIPTNVIYKHFKKKYVMERFDNCSAAVQRLTEELVIEYVKALIEKTKVSVIAVSGGVFMNVKMNQKIMELPDVKKVYFQPSCSDESLVVGAAANIFIRKNVPLKPIKSMYFGHLYTNEDVEEFLAQKDYFSKYDVEYHDDIERKIAELAANFKVVPRFKGPGEWGQRSLCNRAILGNASDMRTFYTTNDQVKMRDFWMPFAPTIMEEWADKYIKNWERLKGKVYDSTKYMILTFDSTELAQQHLRAALHQKDKTLRPQIVSRDDNPDLHRLLRYYEEITGMGGLLNTSLNIHGYPLVGTLEQALFTFENSGLEYLTLENYLIKKRSTK